MISLPFSRLRNTLAVSIWRAVEQGQTLFRFQFDWTPTHLGQHVGALDAASLEEHLALAYQRQEEIGQRREVARRAERAAVVHHGNHVVVVEVEDSLDGLDLDSAESHRQSVRLEQKHEFHDLGVNGHAYAARVALHQVLLECRELVVRDVLAAERPETGGHAIDRFGVLVGLPVEEVAAMLYSFTGLGRKRQPRLAFEYPLDKVVCQFARPYCVCLKYIHGHALSGSLTIFPRLITVSTQFMPT